jgi:hypothetical protein
MNYMDFLDAKTHSANPGGFTPLWMPDFLFDFQWHLVEWAIRMGRAAIFADCGLGKTPMSLVWSENVIRKTNKPVLILTPIAVGIQTVAEGEKFGIEVHRSSDGTVRPNITVTNYERLHLFNPDDFAGVVCDESSILKHFAGATQKAVTRFLGKVPYRLLGTATAAPNDYIELGTSSEALGELGYSDVLSRFFVMDDKARYQMNACKDACAANHNYFAKLSYRVAQTIGQWRLKGHAEEPFWRWVASWARACRKPSDLGFADNGFILPTLQEQHHIIEPHDPGEGWLFTLPAIGLHEERQERKRTLKERCELAARLAAHHEPAIIWCHTNDEGLLLAKLIPDAIEVAGRHSDDEKEEAFTAFTNQKIRALITKPKIGAWGMNWQHCRHVITFASHSYEQFYQSIRRCWRFGQVHPVVVDVIATKGEQYVIENMTRKARAMDTMFAALVMHMRDALVVDRAPYTLKEEMPVWLSAIK